VTVAAVDVKPVETVVSPGAGPDRVTVHCDEAGAVTDVGVQDKLLSEMDGGAPLIVTVAPDPVAAIAVAGAEVAIALST